MNNDLIEVHSIQTLLINIESYELWVKWEVRCEIGPDWIGGGITIQFYLDDRPLAQTPFHTQLKIILQERLKIPDSSPDAVINGEAEINRIGNRLDLDYSWSETVPFAYPRYSGSGTALFIDLTKAFTNLGKTSSI